MSTLGLVIAAIGIRGVYAGHVAWDAWTMVIVGSVLFTSDAAQRIVRAVKQVEANLKNTKHGRRNTYPPMRFSLGKTDAAHNKSASGTVSLWGGALGSETDTGINVTAYNKFANVLTGRFVMVVHTGHGWYLIAAEC